METPQHHNPIVAISPKLYQQVMRALQANTCQHKATLERNGAMIVSPTGTVWSPSWSSSLCDALRCKLARCLSVTNTCGGKVFSKITHVQSDVIRLQQRSHTNLPIKQPSQRRRRSHGVAGLV